MNGDNLKQCPYSEATTCIAVGTDECIGCEHYNEGVVVMPEYRWRCKECSEEIGTVQSIKDSDEPKEGEQLLFCPKCGKKNWAKILQASANRWRYCD